MAIKVSEFIRKVIRVWDDVKGLLSKFLLHLDDIGTKTILSSKLKTVWKMIDLLILIHALVYVLFVGLT